MHARFLTLLVLLFGTLLAQAQTPFVEGQHYQRLPQAQPTQVAPGKVEVLEVFSYGCVHCAHLQPYMESWKKKMPKAAQLRHMPVAWNSAWELYARAFYTAEAMGINDRAHPKLFDAIWKEQRKFNTMDDFAAFYAQFGVTAADFLATSKSFAVDTKIRQSNQMLPRYGVQGTPTIIVAGKYRADVASAGGQEQLMQLIDHLVAKEAAAQTAASTR